jgi:putative transcriptional regulator
MATSSTPIRRTLTDPQIQAVLGRRLRDYRRAARFSLDALAQRTGLSALTIHKAEHGGNFTVRTLLRVLRALGRLEQLDAFLPPLPPSPLELIAKDPDGG